MSVEQQSGRNWDEKTRLRGFYQSMLTIRCAEERIIDLFADGAVPGFIHLSIGQEAVPVGVMNALDDADTIASTHRGHGHCIAKGIGLDGFFAELLGKDEGVCRGRGGSMHIADMSLGMLGANGIVGAGLSLALGSALAHKTLKRSSVAVAFFGDGALAEGLLHECLNMAALWRLPLLFVCENNGWSEFSPSSSQIAFKLADLSAAYAVPYHCVDGNDVQAVADQAGEIVAHLKRDGGPAVLECATTRVRGHYEGDAQKYRSPDERAQLAARDPLRICGDRLVALGCAEDDLAQMLTQARAGVEGAVCKAKNGAAPDWAAARADVYTQSVAS